MSAQTRSSRNLQPLSSGGNSSTLIELPKSTPPAPHSHRPLSPTVAESTEHTQRRYSLPGYTLNAESVALNAAIPTEAEPSEELKPPLLQDAVKPTAEARSPLPDAVEEHDDNGSSSLSELEDGPDDGTNSRLTSPSVDQAEDDDTEAETERLEDTPLKPVRTVHMLVNGREIQERSPSKLAGAITVDLEPQMNKGSLGHGNAALEAQASMSMPTSGNRNVKKRKRTTSESGEADDNVVEEPARKRSNSMWRPHAVHNEPSDGHGTVLIGQILKVEGHAQSTSGEDEEEQIGRSVAKPNSINSTAHTLVVTVSGSNKGKRKGKRPQQGASVEVADAVSDALESSTVGDSVQQPRVDAEETAEAAVDDQDDAALAAKTEEEFLRKKSAMDKLADIEKRFATLRDKLYNEKLQQLSHELELLEQPKCMHPEFLKILQCLDQRRDEKIRLENVELRFKTQALENRVVAERAQILSQYRQDVRELRSESLEKLGQQWYRIQIERRQLHDDDFEYKYLYNPKRSQQILQQTAYNLEVSILSGIAKHRGFPAAPEIEGARGSEFEDDIRKMSLNVRPKPRLPRYVEPTAADRAAAEEQFLQQTPWANPQHPHNHGIYLDHRPTPDLPPNPYTTPAVSQRTADAQVPNGSASTIGLASDPSSSAIGASLHRKPTDLGDFPISKSSPLNRANPHSHAQGTSGPYGGHDDEEDEPATTLPAQNRHYLTPQFSSKASPVNQAFPTSATHSQQRQESELHQSSFFTPAPGTYGIPLATPGFAVQPSPPERSNGKVKHEEEQEPERLQALSPPLPPRPPEIAAHAHMHRAEVHAPGIGVGGPTYGRWRA